MRFLNSYLLLFYCCSLSRAEISNCESGNQDEFTSLVFVFDTTGSMTTELNQVKDNAKKIIKALLETKSILKNFILVPFNDPGFGPARESSNLKEFEILLNNIQVNGGTDCDEMCLNGLKIGLESSLPGSYIYVFTDAGPKDRMLLPEIISIIQRKQSTVTFLLTDGGICINDVHEYRTISTISTGQVFSLKKNDINSVLKYIQNSHRCQHVDLVAVDAKCRSVQTYSVPIDQSINQFMISLTGKEEKVGAVDPNGYPHKVEQLIKLENMEVAEVQKPRPGLWKIKVECKFNYTLRVTGQSKIRYEYGFAINWTTSMTEVSKRPLTGTTNYIYVTASDTNYVKNITNCTILNLYGITITTVKLAKVSRDIEIYYGQFMPALTYMHIKCNGISADGNDVIRITSTAISSQKREKPFVTMEKNYTAYVNNSASIQCKVESLIPFSVKWSKNGKFISSKNFTQTSIAKLEFLKPTIEDKGSYTCEAENIAGIVAASTFLNVYAKPVITMEKNHTVVLNKPILIYCNVESLTPYTVKWLKNGKLLDTKIFTQTITAKLEHLKATFEDEGSYTCEAENIAGVVAASTFLDVYEMPRIITKLKINVTLQEGEDYRLPCSAVGDPQPKLYWLYNFEDEIKPNNFSDHFVVTEDNTLLLLDSQPSQSGNYSCLAQNKYGADSYNYSITIMPPALDPHVISVNLLENAVIPCVFRNQIANVKWFKNDDPIDFSWNADTPKYRLTDEEHQLMIVEAQDKDAGNYSCETTDSNDVPQYFILHVLSSPLFDNTDESMYSVKCGENVTLSCEAIGFPVPKAYWGKESFSFPVHDWTMPNVFLKQPHHNQLTIRNVTKRHDGEYYCNAKNKIGSTERKLFTVDVISNDTMCL